MVSVDLLQKWLWLNGIRHKNKTKIINLQKGPVGVVLARQGGKYGRAEGATIRIH